MPSSRGGPGNLTWIFSDDGRDAWRVNGRGQDACSFFFPDGQRLVWTSTRDNLGMPVGDWSESDNYPQGAELYVSDLKGGNVRRLTNNRYYEAEVSVSPGGRWITFGRHIDGNMDIWVMNWGRATGERFMSNIRTFVMDVSSLDIGPERRVPWNLEWGTPLVTTAPAR